MRWSKNVLRKEEAQTIAIEYQPFRFDLGTPDEALVYLQSKEHGSDFNMSEPQRVQTGIDQIESAQTEGKIQEAALEKLKTIQEAAYKEAYSLGLDEGRKEAFTKNSKVIDEQIQYLAKLIESITRLKIELMAHNESHLVKIMYHMASRIARVQITTHSESVVEAIRSAVALAQGEEKIVVRVAPTQVEFLEELQKIQGREFDFLKAVSFEPAEEVTDGGCIVETNYGEIDSRVEQRVQKLWDALVEALPKVKDKVAS